jgi:antitoxin component of RelBE/YafQ-DinJ toxin-antitoxin module
MTQMGLSRTEAINKILAKIIKHKHTPGLQSPAYADPETYQKLRKQSGMTPDDILKTL